MTRLRDLDLTELQRVWRERRAALSAVLARVDTRGMTRPARDSEERAWLEASGRPFPFVEDEAAAAAARAYYRRRYTRPTG